MPQGPAKAVFVLEPTQPHAPSSFGGGGMTSFSGWPESAIAMSVSGPLGPIFIGVWQAWQSWLSTSRFPRTSRLSAFPDLSGAAGDEAAAAFPDLPAAGAAAVGWGADLRNGDTSGR